MLTARARGLAGVKSLPFRDALRAHPQPRKHISRAFRFHNVAVSMAAFADNQWRFLVVNSTCHLEGESRQLLY